MGGIGNIYIRPGTKVLYLGAASGTTVSHVSDIVGQVEIALFICRHSRVCWSERHYKHLHKHVYAFLLEHIQLYILL